MPIEVELEQHERAPWALATQLAILAANGDLIPPAQAKAYIPTLLRYRLGVRQSAFAPRVSTEADNAIAELSFQVSGEQMETLLDIYEPLIEREPLQWQPYDRPIVQTLLAAYRVYPNLAERAFNGLLRCLGQSHIGDQALRVVAGLASERPALAIRLKGVAEAGNRDAVLALCIAGIHHRLVREQAEVRYRRVMGVSTP